jgi:hypothetical protein
MSNSSKLLCVSLLLAAIVVANEAANVSAAESSLSRLSVEPARFNLASSRARQRLIVSAHGDGSSELIAADLTRVAKFESSQPSVAEVTPEGVVVPRGNGQAEILVRVDDREVRATVSVNDFELEDTVDFHTEVIPALSQGSCNSGPCHGSPQGKNGFRLSLRGFDPVLDFATLVRESTSRRTNSFNPDASLLLQKPVGELPHQGGVRLKTTDGAYQVLKSWIAEGCRQSDAPKQLGRLEVLPAKRQLDESQPQQQLVALAHFGDGSIRDVTSKVVFESSNEAAASVTQDGLVQFSETGESTILVRYLSQVVGSQLAYVRNRPGFEFRSPEPRNYVDNFVFDKLRKLQIAPAELASDAAFLRRVYFDTIGVPPTPEEAAEFLDSTRPDKRSRLIDALLERDEYAFNWALKWADVMRGSEVTISRRGVHSFHRYLVERIRQDRPFDEFARETLTSLGNTLNNPAANFSRIARTPEDAAEAMSQLFMGVRIGCAKCHNHPFEAITQNDYYGFAAYFARVKYKGKRFMLDDEIVYLDRRNEVRHPTTNAVVPPAAFGEPAGEIGPDDDRREKLVEWLVDPSNRYFSRSIVNRLWYHLMGHGIVDPVDDFRDTNPPLNEELLTALADDFIKTGFRIRPVLRVILNSATYQLSSRPAAERDSDATDPERCFAHASIQMLTAEQILDSISSATGVPEKFPGFPLGTRALEIADGDIDHTFLKAFSKPVRDASCECARDPDPSLSGVIHLLNNPSIVGNIRAADARIPGWLSSGLTDDQIVERLYLATISRRPTAQESALVARHLKSVPDRASGLFDVQFALFNSNEFLMRH